MSFNTEIRHHFQFLIDAYRLLPTDVCDNVVEFVGERCRVMIGVEKDGQVVVHLQSNEPQIIRRRGFNLDAALGFLDPGVRLKVRYPPGVSVLTTAQRVEAWLAAYARLLRDYGEPFLQGDFSIWEEVDRRGRAAIEPFLRQLRGEEPFRRGR
jgi:hypothetical protein